ncbi:histone-lysine N-methyltransferase SETD1B-like [Actinia tenebrosa]|uniref:[histone H3]-lysine(4) N-trimethyltransferase n=1 Tax=Actinia tenebrosa TaxID=6105 RepID=A0A6P8IR24_ACTTE|nr:histone-lysine N-methyltransferase SETD1B-like [Actinia tenebrosa]
MSYEPPGFSRKSVYGHEKLYESSSKVGSTFLSSEKPVANGAGRSLSRQEDVKQRRNYKLLIDPALKKGSQKIFRYDGEFDGQSPIIPRDPRSRRTRIWTLNKADLPVPNFKVDKYYVGTPPQREVVFTGLNDNVDRKFLQEMCLKYGKVENIKIYYDPLTKKHTGKAKVTFDLTKSAKLACSKLDGCSVMGNIISTQLEPNLKGLASRLKQQKSLEKPPFLNTNKPTLHYPTPPSTNSHSPSLESSLSTSSTPKVSRPVDPRIRNPPTPVTPPLLDVNSSMLSSKLQQRSSLSSQLSLSGHGSVFSTSLSSSSSFEPISPPPLPKNIVPRPIEDTPIEGAPPLPPPVEQTSSFLNYEDISPEQTYSPEDKAKKVSSTQEAPKTTTSKTSGRSTCDESKIGKMIENLRKDSAWCSPSRDHSRSPKSDKYSSREYRSHDSRHYNDYDDKGDRHRDRYGDYHRDYRDDKDYSSRRDNKRSDGSRYSGRSSSYKHHETWKDSHNDYKSRKSDYSRSSYRDDYNDRKHGDRQKDNSKYKKSDRYTTSPRRPEDRDRYSGSPRHGEEKRKSDSNETHGKEDLRTREWHSRKSPNDYTENKNADTCVSSREERRSVFRTERSLSPQKIGKSPVASSLGSPKELQPDPPLLGYSSGKSHSLDNYETNAYGVVSVEGSNEEPFPPGEEKSFFHEQDLEISRLMKLPNMQEPIRKRKLSHDAEDDNSSSKRLNIDKRGTPFSESESETNTTDLVSLGDFRGSQQASETRDKKGGVIDTELNGTDDTTHADMLQVEDISPCQSPLGVTVVTGNTVVKLSDSNNLYSDIEANEDTETEIKNDGQNDDDDDMSLSSISSNEDTFELNEPSKKISPKNQPVSLPPPNIFQYPPAIIPPPVMYNPLVPPPGMPFPPPPLPPIPGMPPPIPPPTLPHIIPPPSVLPSVQPASVPYPSTYPLHPRLSCGYGQGFEYRPTKQEKLWNWKRQIIDVVSGVVRNELDAVLSRDVFRKLVEASAFKSLEAWWENQCKPKITPSVPSTLQQTSTVAHPSSSTPSTLLGPSPFDLSHSMAMGLRASLPKLPSFKRRAPEPKPDAKKTKELAKSLLGKTVESSLSLKRRRAYDSESEHDTEVELSSREGDKRPRTVSSLVDDGDDERSQSPWQHLDDAAPPAMDVRISKATDRRVSTGSSLYKTIYSSESEDESESEAETEEKEESEDEQAESEEEREEYESETESSEEESGEESDEEDSEESEEEEEEKDNEKVEVEFKKPILSDDAEETDRSFSGTSQSQMPESEISDFDKEDIDTAAIKSTVETITLSQTTNYDTTSGLAIQPRIDKMELFEKDLTTDTETIVSEEEVRPQTDKEEEKTTPVSAEEKEQEKKVDKEVEEITDKPEDKPSLTPHIQSIASLVELDHSYGLVCREETPPIDVITVDQETPDSKFTVIEKEFQEELEDLKDGKKVKAEKKLPKHVFPVRSFEQDDELVYEFLKSGLDYEDAHFLKVGFDQLVQVCSDSVVGAKWSFHPVTAQPTSTPTLKRRRQKSEVGVRLHVTGSARSEGYYKIDSKEKAKYAESVQGIVQHEKNIATIEEPKLDASKGKQLSRENRAMQRRLQSAVCNEDFGDILKFNKLRVRKKQLKFAKSPIHDWGLIALEPIAADEMVIEYLGEMIRQVIADNRERSYERKGIGSSYMFRLDEDTIIDATVKGNFARFINHCCDPNCYAKVIALENEKKIVIYSKRDIKVNEEITYDYKFPLEDEKIPCLCGSPGCRGTLN